MRVLQLLPIRVLNERCDSCASAFLLYMMQVRQVKVKKNQMLQKHSGLWQDVQGSSYKGEQGFLYLRVRVRGLFRC